MRADGRRIKTAQPMYLVAMHFMSERNDSLNSITNYVLEKPIKDYVHKKRDEGFRTSHLAVVIAAYVRAVSQHPMLNRFIINKRLYAHNDISVGMVVLKAGDTEGSMSKMYFKPEMTIFDVQKVIDEYVEKNQQAGDKNATDDIVRFLLSIPGLCRLGVNILKWLDLHNMLTKGIIKGSPFHCSMTITNLASIGTNHIHHHVYNFGSTSLIMSMGNAEERPVRRHGQIEYERVIPFGIVMDERIMSGCQYSLAFKEMEKYMMNPELLEVPPEKIYEDIR